jgi:hypothetical protein
MTRKKPNTTTNPAKVRRGVQPGFTTYTLRHAIVAKRRAHQKQQLLSLVKEPFTMQSLKFMRTIPGAALAVAIIATSGIGVYAVANWFGTEVNTSHAGDHITVSAKDCPASLLQAYQDNDDKAVYDISTTYKIVKPEILSAADIQNNQLVTCEQRAIDSYAKRHFPANYQAGDSHNGLYYAVGKYGTIQNIEGNTVTISDVPIDHVQGDRERITTAITINDGTQVLDYGEPALLAQLKPGDQVYLSFQNPVTGGDNRDKRAIPDQDSTVRVISKTQYNYEAKDKMQAAAAQGAFRIISTSDSFGG